MNIPDRHAALLARELSLPETGVAAALRLLGGGATVPFVARYRKEATQGLDEVALRAIEGRAKALNELDDRRDAILSALKEQGNLDSALERALRTATTRTELEDLYLPFKPKRRTRASDARDKGLGPLAEALLAQDGRRPLELAAGYVRGEVADVDAALAGARDVLAERFAEDPRLRSKARELMQRHGEVTAKRSRSAKDEAAAATYRDYFDFREPARKIPPHRVMALRRGAELKILSTGIDLDAQAVAFDLSPLIPLRRAPSTPELSAALSDGVQRLLLPSLEREVLAELEARADVSAAEVFAKNLEAVLLAPPMGAKRVVAIDPGLRTGMKCVALDPTGRFLGNTTVFGHHAGARTQGAAELAAFVKRHTPDAVAVGNGTGNREALTLAREAVALAGLTVPVVEVSETGASVYSASELAREEHPDLDVTVRGALSIGRRLQDPLAELVKIDVRSLGLGQYQHDVDTKLLDASLSAVVEDCVNRVGALLNSASASLLGYVAGIGPTPARRIVAHRNTHGPFRTRRALLDVQGLGPKTFEQCAGFLRVPGGEPLDASAVHPERYALVERMARDAGVPLRELVGRPWRGPAVDKYVDGDVGRPTLEHILEELARPGRDPRPAFEARSGRDDVTSIDDLEPGMILPGVATNVTHFGAFIDIGVHQDGLVHVSQLADRFVSAPLDVVRPGDRVKVRVLEVDRERRRIQLTMKGF